MRIIIVIAVLVSEIANCAHVGFSETDEFQNVDKNRNLGRLESNHDVLTIPHALSTRNWVTEKMEKQFFVKLPNPHNQVTIKEKLCKRAKSEFYEKHLGSPKSARKILQPLKKDIYNEKQKKRCEACMDSSRCKNLGKCDLCFRFCKDVLPAIFPPPTEAPLLGNVQLSLETEVPITEPTQHELAFLEKSNRYYTIGAFGPGPKQNLLVRLLNVARKDNLDKLVVLAKQKGEELKNHERPVIIDTANAFKADVNNQPIKTEVYTVDANKVPTIDFDLTSKIDRELDMAIQRKQKILGKSYLTSKEVDKIIDHALSKISPRGLSKFAENVVQIGSRSNWETADITTRRSASNRELTNDKEPVEVPSEDFTEEKPLEKPLWKLSGKPFEELNKKIKKTSSGQIKNNKSEAKKQNIINIPTEIEGRVLNKVTDVKPKNRKSYKGDSNLANDDCIENTEHTNEPEVHITENTKIVKPLPPPKHQDIEIQQTPTYNSSLIAIVSEENKEPNNPKMISVSINNKEIPESANQVSEESYLFLESTTTPNKINIHDYRKRPTKQYQEQKVNDKDEDKTQTVKQDDSDPFVGSNWFSDEFNKAKDWWRSNLGMETPQNGTNAELSPDFRGTHDNQTEESLQVAESKSSLINTSDFTEILKNLEKKVENIADLVKKTCGKLNSESENVGLEELVDSTTETEEQPNSFLRKRIDIIDASQDNSANYKTITTAIQTQEFTTEPSWDREVEKLQNLFLHTAADQVNKGANYLINKAEEIADELQKGIAKPMKDERLSKTPENGTVDEEETESLSPKENATVGCSKEESGEYLGGAHNQTNNEDPTVACSKEESEEYVGIKLEKETNEQKTPIVETFSVRSSFTEEQEQINSTAKPLDIKTEENVACSKEESEEYVGKEQQSKINQTEVAGANENVACSKESEEYVGKPMDAETSGKLLPKPSAADNKNISNSEMTKSATNLKDFENKEEVGYSKESKEYVGHETQNTTVNGEAVGCSKEEDDDVVVPVYSSYGTNGIYRESEDSPKSSSNIPESDNLLHHNLSPHRQAVPPNPLQKIAEKKVPGLFSKLDETSNPNIPTSNQESNLPKAQANFDHGSPKLKPHLTDGPSSKSQDLRKQVPLQEAIDNEDIEPGLNSRPQETASPDKNVRLLPPVQQFPEKLLTPPLRQRFAVQDIPTIGKGMHPGTITSWPSRGDIVGSKNNEILNTATDQEAATAMNTQNPFSIFGKVVPQLNNTDISFQPLPNNKIYFVGTGIQLPLNMKKDNDGSYQLSVDVDKLCSSCNTNKCTRDEKLGTTKEEDVNDDAMLGMIQSPEENEENSSKINQNKTTTNNVVESEITNETNSTKSPQLQNTKFPNRMDKTLIQPKNISKENLNHENANQTFKIRAIFPLTDEKRRSEISKRSLYLDSLIPLTRQRDYDYFEEKEASLGDHKNENIKEGVVPSPNSLNLDKLDTNLNKISNNMNRYFDRRQKLENFYRNQNKRDLENADNQKDIAKRRVTLVNNMLTWMKSIAVQNAHT